MSQRIIVSIVSNSYSELFCDPKFGCYANFVHSLWLEFRITPVPDVYSRVDEEFHWIRNTLCSSSHGFPTPEYLGCSPHPNTPETFVKIETDDDPHQTSWAITNENGVLVFGTGGYETPNYPYYESLIFPEPGTYTLTIYDSNNDGMNGHVLVEIFTADGFEIIAEYDSATMNGTFGASLEIEFEINAIAPAGPYAACNVCGTSSTMNNPNAIWDHESQISFKCADIKLSGETGFVSEEYCESLPQLLGVTCGCGEAGVQ